MDSKQKIALVLSGGGARGLSHIGAIEVLEKYGFQINAIAGTSAGSLIGGLYAMGYMTEFRDWVCKLRRRDILSLMDFTIKGGGIVKGKKMFDKLKTFIPDTKIETLIIPFVAVATDILNIKEIAFREGSVFKAIRASVSVPDFFTPVEYNETLLVDGGVLNPVPISQVKREEGDILVVVNLYDYKLKYNNLVEEYHLTHKDEKQKLSSFIKFLKEWQKKIKESINKEDKKSIGYIKLLEISTDTMVNKIADLTIEKYKPDILINLPSDSAKLLDFDKAHELISIGRMQAEKALEEYFAKNKEKQNPT